MAGDSLTAGGPAGNPPIPCSITVEPSAQRRAGVALVLHLEGDDALDLVLRIIGQVNRAKRGAP